MKTNRLFAILLASATIVGCTNDTLIEHGIENQDMIPINVSSSINQVQTKATAAGFVDKDAVGLYAVNYSNNNSTPGTLSDEGNQADNVKYVFDETNHKWNPVRNVYYKDVNTNVDIYLYYPYRADIDNVGNANFEVQKDQSTTSTSTALSGYEASDFLWGKGTNITPVESAVAIEMAHKLSAVQVTLVGKAGFEDGEFENLTKSIILLNTTRKATIDFSTGNATKLGDPQLDGIVMCPQNDGSFRAIVVPQTVPASTKLFSITIDGITYGFSQAEVTEYIAGKQLNFTINITKIVPSGTYELSLGSTQITDWTEDKNTHGGEARQYFVVNVETPGTLGKLIKAADKNPDKIRNLKVTGNVTTSDFYFMRDSMAILEAVNMKECSVVQAKTEKATFDSYGNQSKSIHYSADNVIPNAAFRGKTTLCYFSFPELIEEIGDWAFYNTNLCGALICPNDVKEINFGAFRNTKITTLTLPHGLICIGCDAFLGCNSLGGNLLLPSTVEVISSQAFGGCAFSGVLILPENLKELGNYAFAGSGSFTCGLTIPDAITTIPTGAFNCHFSGTLNLNNVRQLGYSAFMGAGFSGELVIPEGITTIPERCFMNDNFSSVVFPSTLKTIEDEAFEYIRSISKLDFPEGLVSIENVAFRGCRALISVYFPNSLQTIQRQAFEDCYGISKIICNAIEPPSIQSNTFDGVGKDNFTVEVPASSVKRYQAEQGWCDFRRISAHYDFSLSRNLMCALNDAIEKTYTLRAPAGFSWTIAEKPDWVTVTPSNGIGKTEVTISVSAMDRTNETFEINEGTYNSPSYKHYKGRTGEVVFSLTGKDYTCSINIEQYDYDYSDGDVKDILSSSKQNPIDIIFIGDGYDAKDIAKGTFLANAEAGFGHLFDLEPYKTYKDYFNVKAVISLSDESGIGTTNSIIDTKFGSSFTQNRILTPDPEPCFAWSMKANPNLDIKKSLTILLMNTSTYEGICMMYGDGSAIACCPVSTEAYPYDFRGIIQHEAGGHGFGKLGDEYIYHNAHIQTCICIDGCDHPDGEFDTDSNYGSFKSLGWYKNLSLNGDNKQVPWSHLIYNSKYSDYVDMYEGGYMHSRGVYRSEATSCMNNNIPYYSAISRQAIVERIMHCAGETFDLNDFYDKDKDTFGPITKGGISTDRTFGVDPKFNRGSEKGSVVYMGKHPDYSKIK